MRIGWRKAFGNETVGFEREVRVDLPAEVFIGATRAPLSLPGRHPTGACLNDGSTVNPCATLSAGAG